jgi:DNA-binding FadR family transcriptional regulator
LQKLSARQLVTTQRGGGTYVTEALTQSLADPLLELIASSPRRLGDVLELRHAIESLAAHYAALRRTTADKIALRQSYKALITSHAQRDPSLEAQADADFHLVIAEASHNVVLVQVMRSLFALLHSSMRFSLENLYTHQPAIFDNLRDQHYHLLNAILNGDPEQARAASDNHINYVEQSLAEVDAARSPQVSGHAHFSDTTPT